MRRATADATVPAPARTEAAAQRERPRTTRTTTTAVLGSVLGRREQGRETPCFHKSMWPRIRRGHVCQIPSPVRGAEWSVVDRPLCQRMELKGVVEPAASM